MRPPCLILLAAFASAAAPRPFVEIAAAARLLLGAWYAQAAPGWAEGKPLPVRTEGKGGLSPFRHPWESHPAFSLSFGRGF